MRLPQRSLHAVASGQVKNPRSEFLVRIADFHQIGLDWLLRGEGKGPETSDPFGGIQEILEWYDLVISLKLMDERIHNALLRLPGVTSTAALTWRMHWSGRGPRRKLKGSPRATESVDVSPRVIEAIRLEYRAWILLLRDFIEDVGLQKAAGEILHDEAWLRTRFTTELYIDMHEKIAKERDAKGPGTFEDYLEDIARAEGRRNPLREPSSEVVKPTKPVKPANPKKKSGPLPVSPKLQPPA
jgi:hypothetical protein